MAEYIEREALLSAYDREHKGPPGQARKLIEQAPAADVAPVLAIAYDPNMVRSNWDFPDAPKRVIPNRNQRKRRKARRRSGRRC